jgi:hypothetical protein
MQHRISDF